MKTFNLCALLVLLALPAAGVEPYLVKDIEPATTTAGSNPADLVTFRGAVLFFADDGVSGRQLWRTDGTAAGTYPLSDFRKNDYPASFLVTERLYFFSSYDSLGDVWSLWVSDGTPAGTFRLTEDDVSEGSQGLFAASQGILYFMAGDSEHGAELWRSDGTPAGTHIVADVTPGPGGSDIRELTEYRGLVWFNMHGNTIWRTDGTAAGTALAIDPDPSSAIRDSVEYLQVLRGRLVFFAPPRPGKPPQLWAGDGTARGTRPITDLPRGTYLWFSSPVAQAGKLYFYVGHEAAGEVVQTLWVSDGTRRGTRVLMSGPSSRLYMEHLTFSKGMGNRLFFVVERRGYGYEPWVTDGTPGGTRMLQDVCPGRCSSGPIFQEVFDGRLYFTASASDTIAERAGLWSTDGTPEGTSLVNELCHEVCTHGPPVAPFAVGGRLVFVERAGDSDLEVWSTDGTGQGTVQLTDFEPRFPWEDALEETTRFQGAVLNGQLFFNADDGEHGQELWRTDGTRAGTEPVADLNRSILGVSSAPRYLMPLGSLALFFTGPGDAPELWKSDGTEAGTVPVKAFGPEELDGTLLAREQFAEAGGVLVYFAYDRSFDAGSIWRTDGTEVGTFPLTATSASLDWNLVEIEAVGSTVFFTSKGDHGTELWATDGTLAGTRRVLEALPGSGLRSLTSFQGKLYFAAPGLWRSDGTAAGTQAVADVHPAHLTVHAGRLWFSTDGDEQLWSTDGTAAGTRLEVDFGPEPGLFQATSLVSFGDRLLLSFEGQGLWVTDGTEAGTERLVDRNGNGISAAVLGDRLVFAASEVLWESDGTPAGTLQVQPPVRLNDSTALVRAGDRLFLAGNEPSTGWELWAVRP
jgi:ELWxxDGT repeat protein